MDEAGFREFVGSRMETLRRAAYLICGDWHTADDVVSTAVIKVYRNWGRLSRMGNLDAYVRRMVLTAWLDEQRRPWRRERSMPNPPSQAIPAGDRSVTDRLAIVGHLAALPARRRAVIVLRYYCDLSVEETAEVMGCSTGTVKSQTARALDTLRVSMVDISDLA